MCIVYNTIGSLIVVKSHLQKHNVYDFKSIKELINFQKDYSNAQLQIISNHTILIRQEANSLESEIPQLETFIEIKRKETEQKLLSDLDLLKQRFEMLSSVQPNVFKALINYLNKIGIKKKIQMEEFKLDSRVADSVMESESSLNRKKNRYKFIVTQFNDAVKESGKYEFNELERKKNIIDAVNNSIYGAIGEQKVLKELKKLSDNYIVINDFNYSFNRAVYYHERNEYIKSIQIDHLLISPVGVFIIETKNWSEHSLNNLDLRSPVDQIKRANFVLYKILNERAHKFLDSHHWGQKKFPVRNLIVLINRKPKEEFQYVKVLTLNELQNYLAYFQPLFSQREVKNAASYLLDINS